MDFLNSRGGLSRLWASLSADYEKVLNDFMSQSGLYFVDFAKVAKNNQITLLYHASLGGMDKHHKPVGEAILNCAKENWLNPGKAPTPFGAYLKEEDEETGTEPTTSTSKNNARKDKKNPQVVIDCNSKPKKITLISQQIESEDQEVAFKYQLGGFYLTYLMYFRQPYQNFLKIKVDSSDLTAYRKFKASIGLLSNKNLMEEIEFIMMRLKINQAFEIHGFAECYNIDPNTRLFLNCKKHPVTEHIKADRQTQNALSYTKCVPMVQETFRSYLKLKEKFFSMGLESLPALPSTSVSFEREETKDSEVTPMKQELMTNRGEDRCIDNEDNPNKMDIKPCIGTGSISWIKNEREWEISNGTGSATLSETDESNVNVNRTLVEVMESVNGVGEVAETAWRVQQMGEKPRFHHAALLGNEMVGRVFKGEAQKRYQRVRAKQQLRMQGLEDAKASKIPKNPYKSSSGLYGAEEDDDKSQKPVRMKASFSLWNYIRGKGFSDMDHQKL